MELKDLILQTINEIDEPDSSANSADSQSVESSSYFRINNANSANGAVMSVTPMHNQSKKRAQKQMPTPPKKAPQRAQNYVLNDEEEFLELLQERTLVLFEGLNAISNQNLESCLDITINFLEYQLSVIQQRLDEMKQRR